MKHMTKLYQKSELIFSLIWIAAYCVLLSLGDSLSEKLGVNSAVTLPVAAVLSVILFAFIKKNGLFKRYGFCKPEISASKMLFYIPLLLLLSANLWYGIKMNLTVVETVMYMLSMLCVGFLEEVIFRGLLFGAMVKDGVKSAIIVSSVTFGIGHIIRLFNGSQAELVPNLLQVIYAMAAGFMFVMIYYKSKSLVACIVTHGLFNALSVFSDEGALTVKQRIASCVFLVAVSSFYAAYLALAVKREKKSERETPGANP